MAKINFAQPPENEPDLKHWRKSIQEAISGEENAGGKLNGENITNIVDPGTATEDLADVTVKLNALTAALRGLGIFI